MFTIKKVRADHVIDFAAEELKKYLRMMMTEGGDVPISYEPGATEGFRLGLLEDFGLPNEAQDPVLDDVVHIDTDARGGILAAAFPSARDLQGRYPWLKKQPWLLPVAWADRMGSYLRETKHRPDSSVVDALKIGTERLELLKKYGIIKNALYSMRCTQKNTLMTFQPSEIIRRLF